MSENTRAVPEVAYADGDGVVLVHDGYNTHREQLLERIHSI